MRRNGEQRLCHFPHTRLVEIFKVLACQHQRGLFFTHALERISDVLDGDGIGQPDIEFIQRRDGVALGEQLVRHIRQQIQQDRAAHILRHGQQTFYTEHQKAR